VNKQPSKKTNKELEELQQKIEDLTLALQRERADATNIRRRHDEEITRLRTHLKAGLIKDLLPVIDNFERALKHVPADIADTDYVKGVQGVVKHEVVSEELQAGYKIGVEVVRHAIVKVKAQ
jgi:molecular chaperone GrpE